MSRTLPSTSAQIPSGPAPERPTTELEEALGIVEAMTAERRFAARQAPRLIPPAFALLAGLCASTAIGIGWLVTPLIGRGLPAGSLFALVALFAGLAAACAVQAIDDA
jgi:hypothetical protein